MLRRARVAACVLVLLLLQVGVMHRFSHGWLRLDLLMLLAAYLALEGPPKGALVSALVLGLLRDFASAGRPGASAVVMVLGVLGVLLLRDKVYRHHALMQALYAFGFILFCGLLQALGTFALVRGAALRVLLPGALGQALLTSALSPLMFLVFEHLGLVEKVE